MAKRLVNSGKEKVVLGTREISPKIPIELIGCETVQMELDDRKQLISACNDVETIETFENVDELIEQFDKLKKDVKKGSV